MESSYKCQCAAAGVVPAPSSKSDKAKGAAHDADSSSGLSLGSDALALPWYTQQTSLDMHMCCNLVCMALAVLHRMKRHHTVVQVPLLVLHTIHCRVCFSVFNSGRLHSHLCLIPLQHSSPCEHVCQKHLALYLCQCCKLKSSEGHTFITNKRHACDSNTRNQPELCEVFRTCSSHYHQPTGWQGIPGSQ